MPRTGPPSIIIQVVDQTEPDSYLLSLRAALRSKFELVTAPEQVARLMPMRMAVKMTFNDHTPAAVIREMISQVDVTDDDFLTDVQQQMLDLPEWPA